MDFQEYRRYDGLGLAQLVARKEVTPRELLDIAVARTEEINPRLNAVTIPMYDIAKARAEAPLSGPFAGVPFLIKDIFQEYADVLATGGNQALKSFGYRPRRHAEITERWLAAGTVIFGRTNTPELGLKGITEPVAWGAARNPWNPARSTGGSSGGSAAAVAAGIVPMAGANDGGGSIRIPAAACGLFGLKPGRGRTPWGPALGERMHGAVMNHVVSRSVRDSAAMLDATHGSETASLCHLAPPERPYLEEVSREPGSLRIAFSTVSPIGTGIDPEAVEAVEGAAELLEELGHHVEEGAPAIDGMQLAEDFLALWFSNCAASVAEIRRQTGCGNDGFELDTLALAALGHAIRADEYVQAYARCNEYIRLLAEFHQRYDVWMTPTLAFPPTEIGEIATPFLDRIVMRAMLATGSARLVLRLGLVQKMARDSLKRVPFTQLANLTGTPAMSVPLHWTKENLPLGVQFVGPVGDEALLFRLAGQLETAAPWFHKTPN
ncbi:MAG TPA: amidase family protein [Paucimonas sp.]|nr:amidase family protein [Paucimonas sp.]